MGMSKMAGQPGTQGDSTLSILLSSDLSPFRDSMQYTSSLPGKRAQASKKKNNSWPGSVLNVFPTTTSQPQTSVPSALGP